MPSPAVLCAVVLNLLFSQNFLRYVCQNLGSLLAMGIARQSQGKRQGQDRMIVIGLDLGTSGIKALAIDDDQSILAEASAELSVDRPHDGWSEQNPADWIAATETAIAALLDRIDPGAVRGIGLSGQMHGATLLDASEGSLVQRLSIFALAQKAARIFYLRQCHPAQGARRAIIHLFATWLFARSTNDADSFRRRFKKRNAAKKPVGI